ncbi:hypothetical protein ET33_17170 [Paenibacillus tyrfis]|uniref:Uncharacterized protein n=1 Tax=Paenibacillus tyrfis TaxID=1501230 RepID=A0A081NY34_9BACL|nr:hypothetical protein ET33_17170 [Paenibacillus tyrfis]
MDHRLERLHNRDLHSLLHLLNPKFLLLLLTPELFPVACFETLLFGLQMGTVFGFFQPLSGAFQLQVIGGPVDFG